MEMKIFSFFSGAGFLDLGFEEEGYDIVYVNEYDKEFLKVYQFAHEKMNMNKPKYGYYCGDINDFLKGKLRKELTNKVQETKKDGLVGFVGGPPCPDFSIAGKNKGIDGKHGALTTSYKRVILDQEPDFFVFENVKGLWSTKKHRVEYEKIKKAFRNKGYILIDKLVNALDYGVPQDRERIILFGIKYNLINIEKKFAINILKKNFTWGENRKYCKENRDLCCWPETDIFKADSVLKLPDHILEEITIEHDAIYLSYKTGDGFLP